MVTGLQNPSSRELKKLTPLWITISFHKEAKSLLLCPFIPVSATYQNPLYPILKQNHEFCQRPYSRETMHSTLNL